MQSAAISDFSLLARLQERKLKDEIDSVLEAVHYSWSSNTEYWKDFAITIREGRRHISLTVSSVVLSSASDGASNSSSAMSSESSSSL